MKIKILPLLLFLVLSLPFALKAQKGKKESVFARLKVGDIINLKFESNPSMGYSWYPILKMTDILQPAGQKMVQKSQSPNDTIPIVGAPVTQVIMLKAVKKGKIRLAVEYKRIFEKKVKPLETRNLLIVVE